MIFGYILEKSEPINDTIKITIFTTAKLRKPIHIIGESSGVNKSKLENMDNTRASLFMTIKKNKNVELYIRNMMGGGRNGMPSQHAASIKIEDPIINNNTKGVPIIVPSDDSSEAIPDSDDKTNKIVKRDYSEVLKFTEYNRKNLYKIWFCKNESELDDILLEMLNDETNKKEFKLRKEKKIE